MLGCGFGTRSVMHPGIRIICLVVFGLLLSLGGGKAVLPGVLIAVVLYLGPRRHLLGGVFPMLRRMRFLFISLALIYLWFTPGAPLLPVLGHWSPSGAGAREAGDRILVLLLIILMVHLLLQTTGKEQLIGGILWLATPLTFFGLASTRLAVRVTLVLHMMEAVLALGTQAAATTEQGKHLDYLARRIALRYQAALEYADQQLPLTLDVQDAGVPPIGQWSYPVILACVIVGLPRLWS